MILAWRTNLTRPLIKGTSEVETLNNFWPFRFSKGVLIFILFQIANLNRSYRNTCSHFHFFSKRKSGRPDFWKGVHIFVFDENQNVNTFPVQICTEKVFTFRFSSKTQMWTPFQKSGRPDLWFEEIENVNTFPKIWTARFAFWMKMKMWTPFENLNGQKLLRVSTSGHLISKYIGTSKCNSQYLPIYIE